MKTNIEILESDVNRLSIEVTDAYNAHEAAVSKLMYVTRKLYEAHRDNIE